MSMSLTTWLYLIPLIIALVLYYRRHRKRETRYQVRLAETLKSGIAEPLTLHPVIDTNKCIGSSACVKACPEHALGIVRGKAVLVEPDQYSEAYYSLLDGEKKIQWQHYPRDAALIAQWQQQAAVARIAWFSHGFFQLEQQQNQLLLTDLRMGLEPGYSFRFVLPLLVLPLHEQAEVGQVQQLEMPGATRQSLSWLWQRLLGNTELTLAQYLKQTGGKAEMATAGD